MPALNPADPYRTWLMGVRRTLQRTGYPEAAKHVGKYDRDLRGVYLSGAGPAEGAGVVSRRWQGGYAENRFAPSGPLLLVSSVLFGGVLLYLVLRPKTSTSATGAAPAVTVTPTVLDVRVTPPDLCQPKSKVDAFATSIGKHATYDQTSISASSTDASAIAYVADQCSFFTFTDHWTRDDATNAAFGAWLTKLAAQVSGPADLFML